MQTFFIAIFTATKKAINVSVTVRDINTRSVKRQALVVECIFVSLSIDFSLCIKNNANNLTSGNVEQHATNTANTQSLHLL